MTVRELIKELIDYNLDAEIVVATDKKYINELGHECKGRMFDIKNIDTFSSYVEILFEDWRSEDFDHEGFYNFLLNTIQPNEMEKYRSMFLSSGEIVN